MKAFVFPGQGSQYVGMGLDLSESFPEAKHVFEEIDDTLEQNLSKIMFEGPEEELILTENTQPALMAVSIAIIEILKKRGFELSGVLAGHSLGEYTALTASNSFSIKDAALTLKIRGKAMQSSVGKNKGSMAAILGLNFDQIEEIISKNKLQEDVFIANDNADGQVVLSGLKEGIESSLEIFKENGAKKAMKLAGKCTIPLPFNEACTRNYEKITIFY
jgi:[acyl-carrier-protein] S-malonyltransferase